MIKSEINWDNITFLIMGKEIKGFNLLNYSDNKKYYPNLKKIELQLDINKNEFNKLKKIIPKQNIRKLPRKISISDCKYYLNRNDKYYFETEYYSFYGGINHQYIIENAIETCHPIPLTEEWLKNLGFIKKDDSEGFFKNGLVFYNGFLTDMQKYKIEYIHQLQNLYFALTGEEFELNT